MEAAPRPYHHGNLKAALIEAAIALIEEKGPDHVSVAEAGKRAGVSSGAPFRHFESKQALMTAVAEVFQDELVGLMVIAHDQAPTPRDALLDMGMAFVDWGLSQPMHFRTYSNRNFFDFESSPRLIEGDTRLAGLVIGSFERLLAPGADSVLHARRLYVASRGLLTGLIDMHCHGQFPRFGLNEPPSQTLSCTWELFLNSVVPSATMPA